MINITLSRITPNVDASHLWGLRVAATGSGVSSAIFVFNAKGDGDVFECVASAHQMNEIPEKAAVTISENLQIPFFRKSEATFACKNAVERERIWTVIVDHVQQLVNNLNKLSDSATTVTTVTIDRTA